MESRPLSLVSAKKLLVSNGYDEKAAERIIATAGLHEGKLNEIASFKAPKPEKELLSKYLALYPPAVVSAAKKSGIRLRDNSRMNALERSLSLVYHVDYSHLVPFKKLAADPCSKWSDKLKGALKKARKDLVAVQDFPSRFDLECKGELASKTEEWYRTGGFRLVLYPSSKEAELLKKEGARLDFNYQHAPGSLGFARFYISDGRLIVTNLQSDLFRSEWHESLEKRIAIRKRYGRWGNVLLSSLEKVAKNAGLKEMVMLTAYHINDKYGMNRSRMFNTYSELPQSEGYSLFETPGPRSMLGKQNAKTIFWRKVL